MSQIPLFPEMPKELIDEIVDKYGASEADMRRIAELGGVDYDDPESDFTEDTFDDEIFDEDDPNITLNLLVKGFLHIAAHTLISDMLDMYRHLLEDRSEFVYFVKNDYPEVREMLYLGLKALINDYDIDAVNSLGAHYYLGDIVEQDYNCARELYEAAADEGNIQSMINLGYIWEYGRCGTVDVAKAYQLFALAASLSGSSEALYKLGDMYSRGKNVERNLKTAYRLWSASLDNAETSMERAQPEVRIGMLLLDKTDSELAGTSMNALRALDLLNDAEIGLRIEIKQGATYYKDRLDETIAAQARARDLLEHEVTVLM